MENVKERAKLALIRRINNYHTKMLITDFVEDTIDELWGMFEADLIPVRTIQHTTDCRGIEIESPKSKKKPYAV